jgi:hypothetical protein
MLRLSYVAIALSLLLAGCLEGAGAPPDSSPDAGPDMPPPPPPPPPAPEPELAGLYHAVSVWDLGSAITEHPGVGTIVADLIVEQVVSLAGVPSPLEDAAREQVAAAIHEPIRDYVDARVPSDLAPDSPFLTSLAEILGDVEVESDIELTVAGSDSSFLGGAETVTAMTLRRGERSVRLPVDLLELGEASVPVGALIEGRVDTSTTIDIEPHEFALRIDVLLTYAATELLDALGVETLAEQVAAALECTAIVQQITGGSATFTFDVSGMTFTVDADSLLDGCVIVRAEVAGFAFGLINPGLGVAVGGSATAIDANRDAIVERLAGGADYGGLVTAIPLPTPTRFNASFTALRAQ